MTSDEYPAYATAIEDRSSATSPEVPLPLTTPARGSVAVDPSDQSHRRPMVEQFELRVRLNPADLATFVPGQTAHVRFKLEKQPLIQQWARRLFQLIQEHQQHSNQSLTT